MSNLNGPRPNAQETIAQGIQAGLLNQRITAAMETHNNSPSASSRQELKELIVLLENSAPWQPTLEELNGLAPDDIARKLRAFLRQPRQLDTIRKHAAHPPPVSFLVKGWMPDATLTILAGAGGAGKSRIALQLAIAVATGAEDFIPPSKERPPPGKNAAPKLIEPAPAPVVFAAWETRHVAFANRLAQMCGQGKEREKKIDQLDEKLHYVNMRPAGGLWGAAPGRHTSTAGEQLPGGDLLLEYAAQAQARLLIIDPVAAAYAANENDRTQVRAFLSTLDQWADDHSCAVLIIQHPSKNITSAQSGNTDWRNGVQAVWDLQPGKTDKKDDWTKPRTLKVDKLNEGPIPVPVNVDYEGGRFVEVNDAGKQANNTVEAKAAADKTKGGEEWGPQI